MMIKTPKHFPHKINAAGGNVTETQDLAGINTITFQAEAVLGASWSSAVLSLMVSGDGVNFYALPGGPVDLSADGLSDIVDASGWAFARVEVSTTNASAPIVHVWFNGRP